MAPVHLNLDEIEASDEPSVVFELDGREWSCRNRQAVPALILDALLGGAPMRLDMLFRGLLVEEQCDDFVALMARPDSPFTLERYRRLAETLTEAVLNRPTVRPGPSGRGPRRTGATSKAASSSRAGRSKKRAG